MVVIGDADLALGVGPQVGNRAASANLGMSSHEPMRQLDRQRHQRRRFLAREAEHHALVPGSLRLAGGRVFVHALCDVAALLVE